MLRFDKIFQEGQDHMAYSLKSLVYNSNPAFFEMLDYDDDSIFFEPLLFSYFNTASTGITLQQTLFGYIDYYTAKKTVIQAYADNSGIIYLPNLGYLATDLRDTTANISYGKSRDELLITHNVQPVPYRFKKGRFIEGTRIELYQENIDLYKHIFFEEGDSEPAADGGSGLFTPEIIANIERAHQIIATYNPFYYPYIKEVGRGIFLYRNNPLHSHSFASVKALGTIFLKLQEYNNVPFFIEELVHQFGHCILSVILAKKEEFFKVSIDTPMSVLHDDESDGRTLYDAFHGLFTTYAVAQMHHILYEKKVLPEEEQYEIAGRFANNYYRVNTGIERIDHELVLTKNGLLLYHYLRGELERVYKGETALINSLHLSDQPFVFDYRQYLQTNPLNHIKL